MSFGYTTSDLLESIKQRGMVPTSQNTFQNPDFLRFATEVINLHIGPNLIATRQEYFVYPIDRALVQGQTAYLIPTRAMGDGLRSLFWLNTDGAVTQVTLIDLDNQDSLNEATLLNATDYSAYKQGSEIIVKPTPSVGAGSLRFFILIRPGKLVETSEAAQIATIDTGTKTVTVTTIPSSWVTGETLDFIQSNPHYRYLDIDRSDTTITGTSITFASDLPDDLAVGDWLALQGESPIPQIPHELMPLLAQWTAEKCVRALGDREGAAAAEKERREMQKDALMLTQPRVKGERRKVVNRNRMYLLNRTW